MVLLYGTPPRKSNGLCLRKGGSQQVFLVSLSVANFRMADIHPEPPGATRLCRPSYIQVPIRAAHRNHINHVSADGSTMRSRALHKAARMHKKPRVGGGGVGAPKGSRTWRLDTVLFVAQIEETEWLGSTIAA